MLYLAFIFHMHQPYYKNLLTQEIQMPWVRLHGTKDYLDMVKLLERFPLIHQTFNLVPALIEQIEDYTNSKTQDRFLELSYKPANDLTVQEKDFLLKNFFLINKERGIFLFPRYYELYLKKERKLEFTIQDYLDLQVWFNLTWIDQSFRESSLELKNIINKARFFSEDEKRLVLDKQIEILKQIIPTYKKFCSSGQIELTLSPYYHPILPLLYSSKVAKEANLKTVLPKINFCYPEDIKAQIDMAIKFHQERFGMTVQGMWPSEQSVSEHILPFIIQAGINWVITDEAILFKSLKKKKRDTHLLYQPYLIKRKEGNLSIVFRDRNLSDLIGFVYHKWKTENAVDGFMKHLKNIALTFKKEDILVTVAMDGENAWEYYPNDGNDFLGLLYQKLSESDFVKTTTVNDYLKTHSTKLEIRQLAAGSWIYADFLKWIGSPYKNRAWECLTKARQELESPDLSISNLELASRQIYIAEGSDWFWWFGEDHLDFDQLFRMHLANFYNMIGRDIPDYLKKPLTIET